MHLLKKVNLTVLAAMLMVAAVLPAPAFAAVAVTAASGGAAISADTAASVNGTFTNLSNPSFYEGAPGDISTGALVLAAPDGFELRRQRVTAFASPGGSAATSITLSPTPDCTAAGRTAFLSASAESVTVHVCSDSTDSGKRSRITLSGLAVRPLAGTPLASGDLTMGDASTATVAGVTPGQTSLAQLTTVAGDLAAVALTPSTAVVAAGGTQSFAAEALDQHGNLRSDAITFAADSGVGVIDQAGTFSAGTSVASSPAGVTASAGDVTATAAIDVIPADLARIDLSPAAATTDAGSAIGYVVEGFDVHNNSRGPIDGAVLTMTPTDSGADGGATCDADGFCSTTRATEFAVDATFGDFSDTAALNVLPAALADVTLTPNPAEVAAGRTLQFDAVASDTYGNVRPDAFSYSAAPTAGSIDGTGLLTAETSTATIPGAVTAATGGLSDSAELTITPGDVASVTIAPLDATATAGEAVAYSATASDEFGNAVDASGATFTITPTESEGGSLDGATCADADCSAQIAGGYDVTTTVDGQTATTTLTITPAEAATLDLSPVDGSVAVTEALPYAATVRDEFGNARADVVTFTADAAAGTIDATTGVLTAGTVAGSVTDAVTATSGALSTSVDLDVLAGPLTDIVATLSATTIAAGDTTTASVSGSDAHGNAVDGADATFGITPTIGGANDGASCDDAGVCSATAAGTYRIDAASGSATDSVELEVIPAELAEVTIDPTATSVIAGTSATFEGTPLDRFGNVRDDAISYAVLDAGVGFIDQTGLLTAGTDAGTFPGSVEAAADGFTAIADVTITTDAVDRLEISPLNATAVAGDDTTFDVVAYDQFDNIVDDAVAALSIEAAAPEVTGQSCTDADGQRGCRATTAGDYVVTATYDTATVSTNLTIVPADLARIAVAPSTATAAAGDTATFVPTGFDAFDNPVATGATASLVPTVDGDASSVSCSAGDCRAEVAGTYDVSFTDGDITGLATLEVSPAEITDIVISPGSIMAPTGADVPLIADGVDAFGNTTTDVPVFLVLDSRAGSMVQTPGTSEGVLTTGDIADIFFDAVEARVADIATTIDVDVLPGDVAEIVLTPGSTVITAGAVELFAVEGRDVHGNSLGAVDAVFTVRPLTGGAPNGAGCNDGGECTGTTAGTYEVTATHTDSGASDTSSLTVEAGQASQVLVDPSSATVRLGRTQQFTATVTDNGGNPVGDQTVVWSVDTAAGTIDGNGLLTAGENPGDYTVTASSNTNAGGQLVGTADVTLEQAPAASIVLSPASSTIVAGESQTYTTEAFDADGFSLGTVAADLAISGDDAASCDVDSCTATAADITHTVTATFGDLTDTATLDVLAGAATQLQISPESSTIEAGTSQMYSTTATDAHGNDLGTVEATLSIDSSGPDSCGSVGCTAFTAGTFTVTASFEDATAAASLQVVPAEAAEVTLTPNPASVPVGVSTTFTAEVNDTYGNARTGDALTWSADPAAGTIDADGVFTATGSAGDYAAAVTATAGSASGTADVTVTPGTAQRIELLPADSTIGAGSTQPYEARAFDAAGNDLGLVGPLSISINQADGAPADGASCDATSCAATVAGSHTVTATYEGLTDSSTLQVTPGAADTLSLSPATATVAAGETQPYSATATDAFGNTIGEVSATYTIDGGSGSCEDDSCAATTVGTYTITGSFEQATGTATLDVVAGPAASVSVAPGSATVVAGETQQFTATAVDAFGNAAAGTITWSADAAAGSMDADGLLTAAGAAGTTADAVTATIDGVSDSADVTITPGAVASLAVTPDDSTITAGDSQTFAAEGRDAFGNPTGDATDAVFSIDGDGGGSCDGATCTATEAGARTVTATSGDVTGAAILNVVAGDITTVTIDPSPLTVAAGSTEQATATATDTYGNVVDTTFAWTADAFAGQVDQQGLFTAEIVAGDYPAGLTATAQGITATADVIVTAGQTTQLVLTPADASTPAGERIDYTASGADEFGNDTGLVEAVFSISASGDGADDEQASCIDNSCGAGATGTYTIIATDGEGRQGSTSLTVTPGRPIVTSVTASPSQVTTSPFNGNTSTITILVTDVAGNPSPGVSVDVGFAQVGSRGVIAPELSEEVIVTGADGRAIVTYTSGSADGTDHVFGSVDGVGRSVPIRVSAPNFF